MTATDFQTLAIGWIGTAVVVGVALVAAYATLKGKIDDLQAKHEENAARLNAHDSRAGIDTELVIAGKAVVAEEIPSSLPDPQAFRQPLGIPLQPPTQDQLASMPVKNSTPL